MTNPPLQPDFVLAPKTAKGLQEILTELHSHGAPWLPCGLGTRLNWGAPVQPDSKPISVKGLKRIIEHAIDDLTVTVEAGMPLAELQAVLAEHQQWLPVDWPWGSQVASDPASAGTIGGLVARGLSGSLRQRHFGIRDQIIGIGMLRSNGIAAHAGGRVVKNVAGYDLMRLLCGSWGSLAMITELTLRTQPIRPSHTCLHVEGGLTNLEAFRADLIRSSCTPEYCDWIGESSSEWLLEIGLASVSTEAVNYQLNQLKALAKHHQLDTQSQPWTGPFPEQKFPNNPSPENCWLVRVALPPAQIHHLLSSQELTILSGWEWRLASGVGVGDGWQDASLLPGKISPAPLIDALRVQVQNIGGQLTVLNQPRETGQRLPAWLDANSRVIIEAVKEQFDPKHQLAKGRLPGIAG